MFEEKQEKMVCKTPSYRSTSAPSFRLSPEISSEKALEMLLSTNFRNEEYMEGDETEDDEEFLVDACGINGSSLEFKVIWDDE